MTRIEFKFKIPYGAIREAHFQTTTRLSLKKEKKKKETQYLIKRNNCLFTEQKKQKKKKIKIKTPKTQIVFPDQTTDYRFILIQTTDSSMFLQTHKSDLRCNKNPKTQIVFADQNLDSLKLPILRCSFKHTDRTCVLHSIKQTKKKKPLQRWRSPFIPCNRRFISYPASTLQ